jgi:hypothetical protein
MLRLTTRKATQLLVMLSGFILLDCQNDNTPKIAEQTCMKLSTQQAGAQIVEIYRLAMNETNRLTKNYSESYTIEA